MISTSSSRKRIAKVSSDSSAIGFDLLSSLTYMAVLAIGSLPRDRILEQCARQNSKTSVYFHYILRLVKRVGMEYTRAFQLVAQRAGADNVKSLLLRFAASISSGESEQDFIVQETKAEGERYAALYDRSVENLRKWTDAYAAILISVTLIMVVSLVSSMLGSIDQNFVILMAFTLFFITTIGVYVIYKSAPVEQITYDRRISASGSWRLLIALAPLGVILATLLGPRFGLVGGFAVGFSVIGLSLAPAGFLAMRDSGRVSKLDSELPTFLRSLGTVAGATGFTVTQALTKIDTKSMGTLKTYINRLNTRLAARLPVRRCWDRFRDETRSELVSRTTHMLMDGAELGGQPEQVGQICSEYAQKVTQMRAKLSLTSSTFSYLAVPMHATTTFILVFVLHIIAGFNQKLGNVTLTSGRTPGQKVTDLVTLDAPSTTVSDAGSAAGDLRIFEAQDLSVVTVTILVVIVILTVSNSLAPKFASGGSNLMIASYLSIMCLISGGVLGVVPMLVSLIFTGE